MRNVPQSTSSRLLLLLGYLQSQPVWSGPDLVALLGVTDRTLRKDIERLRELGYPVDATRGPGGGYRLGRHGQLPPLLLSDDEAVAVAIGLGNAASAPGLADASASRDGQAGADAAGPAAAPCPSHPRQTPMSGRPTPAPTSRRCRVDPDLLAQLAAAISDRAGVRFTYDDAERPVTADPYRLVSWQQRWYLVAREHPDREWRVFRVDWMRLRFPGAARFAPAPLKGGDYASFVLRHVASTGWKVHARILVDAPAQEVLDRINPAVGVVETVDDGHCVLVTGADSIETVAVWIGMLGIDFHVNEPPELVEHLRVLARRYQQSV